MHGIRYVVKLPIDSIQLLPKNLMDFTEQQQQQHRAHSWRAATKFTCNSLSVRIKVCFGCICVLVRVQMERIYVWLYHRQKPHELRNDRWSLGNVVYTFGIKVSSLQAIPQTNWQSQWKFQTKFIRDFSQIKSRIPTKRDDTRINHPSHVSCAPMCSCLNINTPRNRSPFPLKINKYGKTKKVLKVIGWKSLNLWNIDQNSHGEQISVFDDFQRHHLSCTNSIRSRERKG